MKNILIALIVVSIVAVAQPSYAQAFKSIEKELKRLKEELTLTDRQVARIRLIMEDKRAERVDIRRAEEEEGVSKALTRSKLEKVNYEERQEITAVLTPKQLKTRELLKKKALSKAKKQ